MEGGWTAHALDAKRILLTNEEGLTGMPTDPAGLASCPIEVFKDFLIGLHAASWSGVLSVDTGYGIKKVFLAHGEIVFAASNIIDDRLGEVIYREARISLDELTDSAAQVTKSRKFGQVLLSSGIFTNVKLWQALKLQVKQILRSLFMVDRVFFSMQEGTGLAPTEVVFSEPAGSLVLESYSYGCAFRVFLAKLRTESEAVLLVSKERAAKDFAPGTFIGDLVELIHEQTNIQMLLDTSKLIDTYTVAALFHLVNLGLCKVVPDVPVDQRTAAAVAPLKAKLDSYAYVLQSVRRGFTDAGQEFPAEDVQAFAASLNPEGFPSLFLDANAELGLSCINGVASQCVANPQRVAYFAVRVESLIQFLLQVAGDNLARSVASKIRQDYRSVCA